MLGRIQPSVRHRTCGRLPGDRAQGGNSQDSRHHKRSPGGPVQRCCAVSFNAPAFESYGKEQSFNAPVGTYAAYAYTTALNYLLGDRTHGTTIGDTAVVYWSEEGDERYQNIFACVSEPTMENQEIVDGVFKNLAEGKAVAAQDVQDSLDMDRKFYILGLAPNAARLAVRFSIRTALEIY